MWFELHDGVVAHPKTCRAARALGINRAAVIGHLACLWLWATRYAQDGDISRFDAADIAEAAGFDGDPQAFLDAMVTCGPGGSSGYIDQDADCRRLHDWMDHTGRTLATRVADLNRKRQARRPATTDTNVNTAPARPAVIDTTVNNVNTVPPDPSAEAPAVVTPDAPRTRTPAPAPHHPSRNELGAYMLEINDGRFTKPQLRVECEAFLDHFNSKEWRLASGKPMRDWQLTTRSWLRRAVNMPAGGRGMAGTYDTTAAHFEELLEDADA